MDYRSTHCVIMSSRGATGDAVISLFTKRLLRFATQKLIPEMSIITEQMGNQTPTCHSDGNQNPVGWLGNGFRIDRLCHNQRN